MNASSIVDPPRPLQGGLTLRQWYAGQAIAGLGASAMTTDELNDVIRSAFFIADRMLAYEADNRARETDLLEFCLRPSPQDQP